jgi:undecaprenyl-diphosphatase
MPGLVIVNPSSGTDDTSRDELAELFPDADIEETRPDHVEDQIAEGRDGGRDWIGIAGGDGTIRCAAEALAGGDVPLLAIPGGTLNHFARSLGIDTFELAAEAASAGIVERVDVGEVNGRVFVNNSSVGLYAQLVLGREARAGRLPKRIADVAAAWEQLTRGHRVGVTIDDERFRAWMVFVGNGRYGQGIRDLASREDLTDHVLDVRVVRGDRRLARLRVTASLLIGGLDRSQLIDCHERHQFEIELNRSVVEVALDGEVMTLQTPLKYHSRAGALPVLVPPSTT